MNEARLTPQLMNQIQRMASRFGRDPMDADDILSEILEAIFRLCSDSDSNSRILTKARWIALSHKKTERIYTKYVGVETDATAALNDDEEEIELDFTDELTPEMEAEHLEMAAALEEAISTLDVTDQKIVRLLKDGFQPADIARKMAVSRSAISQRMSRIASIFASAGFSPAGI